MSINAQLAKKTKLFIKKLSGFDEWVQVKELRSISVSPSEAEQIDCTDLDSESKEYLPGMPGTSTLSLDLMVLESDPGQAEMLAAFKGDVTRDFKIETKLKRRLFSGTVAKWPEIPTAEVGEILKGAGEVKVSGAVTTEDI